MLAGCGLPATPRAVNIGLMLTDCGAADEVWSPVSLQEAVWEADRSVGLSAVVRSSTKDCPIAAGSAKDQKKGSCGRSQSLVQADTWPV